MANLGIPVKLLHESLGHIITVELKTGEVSLQLQCGPLELIADVPWKADGGLVRRAV